MTIITTITNFLNLNVKTTNLAKSIKNFEKFGIKKNAKKSVKGGTIGHLEVQEG